jgi:DNA-directed RNA polymerase specialized sigma24 family protein
VSEQDVDWSVLEYPGVRTVARKAASKVATDYSDLPAVDYDDLYQEALILLATNGEVQDCLGDPDLGLGVLYHRTVRDLENTISTEARRHVKHTSYDAIVDAGEDVAAPKQAAEAEAPGGDYSRELVEQLLPAVWDSSLAFGMTNPQAPDPDMPRATIDVSHGCTLYAHLADIRSAWKHASLSLDERRALLLRYGMGWKEREIGAQLGSPQRTVSDWITRGVGRMRDYLNGAPAW